MKMSPLRWFASLFLLLIFLGSKSMEYHSAAHMDEGQIECKWCDFALLLQATPFEPTLEATPGMVFNLLETRQADYPYTPVFVSKESVFRNFSRPPPSLS